MKKSMEMGEMAHLIRRRSGGSPRGEGKSASSDQEQLPQVIEKVPTRRKPPPKRVLPKKKKASVKRKTSMCFREGGHERGSRKPNIIAKGKEHYRKRGKGGGLVDGREKESAHLGSVRRKYDRYKKKRTNFPNSTEGKARAGQRGLRKRKTGEEKGGDGHSVRRIWR